MGCGCGKRKESMDIARRLATQYSKLIKEDVRIYSYINYMGVREYNYEPASGDTGILVEIIKYEDFSDNLPT